MTLPDNCSCSSPVCSWRNHPSWPQEQHISACSDGTREAHQTNPHNLKETGSFIFCGLRRSVPHRDNSYSGPCLSPYVLSCKKTLNPVYVSSKIRVRFYSSVIMENRFPALRSAGKSTNTPELCYQEDPLLPSCSLPSFSSGTFLLWLLSPITVL